MAHRTLINGTGYDMSGGRDLIGGTGYGKKKGRVLVNGTGYDVPFSSGIPIGTLAVGSTVKIGVNGKSYDFLVVNQGIPSNSSLYDSSCNGTWLLMKDIYEKRQWNSSYTNDYKESTINAYLNGDFIGLIDSNVRNSIRQIKIPYANGTAGTNVSSGANGLSSKIFLLSWRELGGSTMYNKIEDGGQLDYFNGTGLVAYMDGNATDWWLRTRGTDSKLYAVLITTNGGYSASNYVTFATGIRPAFTLPSEFPVVQNADGTYAPA